MPQCRPYGLTFLQALGAAPTDDPFDTFPAMPLSMALLKARANLNQAIESCTWTGAVHQEQPC
jgi:hypothetical protein